MTNNELARAFRSRLGRGRKPDAVACTAAFMRLPPASLSRSPGCGAPGNGSLRRVGRSRTGSGSVGQGQDLAGDGDLCDLAPAALGDPLEFARVVVRRRWCTSVRPRRVPSEALVWSSDDRGQVGEEPVTGVGILEVEEDFERTGAAGSPSVQSRWGMPASRRLTAWSIWSSVAALAGVVVEGASVIAAAAAATMTLTAMLAHVVSRVRVALGGRCRLWVPECPREVLLRSSHLLAPQGPQALDACCRLSLLARESYSECCS